MRKARREARACREALDSQSGSSRLDGVSCGYEGEKGLRGVYNSPDDSERKYKKPKATQQDSAVGVDLTPGLVTKM